MLCFDLCSEVLRNCNKKVPFVYMRLHLDLFIFTHLLYVSRYPFAVRYLLWNLIPDSERPSQHHFKADYGNHFALQHLFIYLPIYLSINVSVRFSRNTGQTSKDVNGVIRKLSVITGFFLVCYSPYIITQVLQGTLYDSTYSGTIHAVSLSLTLLNSPINPVLYVWRFNEARFQLKFFVCVWNKRKTDKIILERNSFFATYSISHV